jgi:hypothetical protein
VGRKTSDAVLVYVTYPEAKYIKRCSRHKSVKANEDSRHIWACIYTGYRISTIETAMTGVTFKFNRVILIFKCVIRKLFSRAGELRTGRQRHLDKAITSTPLQYCTCRLVLTKMGCLGEFTSQFQPLMFYEGPKLYRPLHPYGKNVYRSLPHPLCPLSPSVPLQRRIPSLANDFRARWRQQHH